MLDAYSRRLGDGLSSEDRAGEDALEITLQLREPALGLIHHSDRGSQYPVAFGQRLTEAGVVPSMGSVADPYDNTLAESFLTTLKRGLVDRAS